ncbi:MAG: glucosaminidase domain-containing protein [Burkholderiaceae bacterium]
MLNTQLNSIGAGEFPALPGAGGARSSGSSSEFTSLYRQLNDEVGRFIAEGSVSAGGTRGGAAPAAPAAELSPQGLWSQLQAGEVGEAGAPTEAQQEFLRQIAPLAQEAGQRLGVSAEVLAAHAALESGWGAKPVRRADGSSSHNLFGIKAGASWRGDVAEAATTEYQPGQAQPISLRQDFRSYASPAQSFQDLTQLLLGSPRYQGALQAGGNALAYGQALQKGGYATDPAYADKLARVAARIKGAL